MNSVNLIGNLTRDPELRKTQGGTAVCNMRVAINGIREDEVDYVDVVTFEAQAEACAKYLTKGRKVGVTGRLSYSEWAAEDGSKRSKHEVIGRVEFLGSPSSNENGAGRPNTAPAPVGASEAADDEIPF